MIVVLINKIMNMFNQQYYIIINLIKPITGSVKTELVKWCPKFDNFV